MSRQGQPIGYERVVLLAEDDDVPIGTADKATVHHATTPRHRGFSCYVMDASHRVLVTRRSLTKRTWPGVWSNSFCGHPAPGEPYEHAVHRRAADELGLALFELRCVLPSFRYAATDLTGIVENEHCTVYVATTASIPVPDPGEVCELAWTTGDALLSLVQQTPGRSHLGRRSRCHSSPRISSRPPWIVHRKRRRSRQVPWGRATAMFRHDHQGIDLPLPGSSAPSEVPP